MIEKATEIANKVATTGFTEEAIAWVQVELQKIHDLAVELGKELGVKTTTTPPPVIPKVTQGAAPKAK